MKFIDDYRAAFGRAPPAEASVAIMSDADNTGQSATAYVDDIVVRRAGSRPATLEAE